MCKPPIVSRLCGGREPVALKSGPCFITTTSCLGGPPHPMRPWGVDRLAARRPSPCPDDFGSIR
jgi:hypothetical protein